MKKIVLALDFSKLSIEVERVGTQMANLSNEVELYFISVINPTIEFIPPDTGVLVGAWEARLEQAKEKLQEIREKYPSLPVHIMTLTGDPKFEILYAAEEIRADMLVIGTHGRTGWNYTMMGSNAEYIVRHSTIPVLVVPFRTQTH